MHPGTYAATTPDKAAVVMAAGTVLTYAELEAQSNQLAHHLRSIGLQRGDHLAFVMENRPEVFVVAWAALRAGLVFTPCSTLLTAGELEYLVRDCDAQVLIATDETVSIANGINGPLIKQRLVVGASRPDWSSFDATLAAQPTTPIDDQSPGAELLYSSGTTGQPKGVVRPLPDGPYPEEDSGFGEMFGLDRSTVYLSPAPLYHAAPLGFCLFTQTYGGTVVVQEHFDPTAFLSLIEQHQVTFTQVVPTMFIRLLKLPDATRSRFDTSSLTRVLHGAAPCPVEVKERMIEWWGPIIDEYYSGTEGGGLVYCDSEEWLAHRGTVGKSVGGPLHILDDDGNELPPGEIGTIYFDDWGAEYRGDPDKTAQARDAQGRGWSSLGDVGYVDAEGYLYLTDRKAHVIISGGVNIYPQEAENALIMHPKVEDIAVFGVPDEEMGESVHAVVQPAPGVTATAELADELTTYCRERLARYKCPRTLEFREEVPRHPTGKLHKRLLKEEYWPTPDPAER